MSTLTALVFLIAAWVSEDGRPNADDTQQGYTDCVVKYRSAWGEDCSQCAAWNDSYVVYLKNNCTEPIDVMVCVQEETMKWRRFKHEAVASGDSLRAYACVGTGKYLAWARKAGDETVVFPTLAEVNAHYTD